MSPKKASTDVPNYQIKVTLDDSKPPIWRRILVRSDITLGQLHDVLQAVMGWADYHLHQFIVGRTYYGVPDPAYEGFVEMHDESRVSFFHNPPKGWTIKRFGEILAEPVWNGI